MDLRNLPWRKSSFSSANGGDCVEVAELDVTSYRPEHKRNAGHAVRDSKDPAGPVLYFTTAEWRAFLDGVKASEFGSGGLEPPEQPRPPRHAEQFRHDGRPDGGEGRRAAR